jgi:drug/metabolite transporter (DMT)-like permease
MARHSTSGNWKLGLGLSLLAVLLWSTLPVALKLALDSLDAFTLTWVRFVIAAVCIFSWLLLRGSLRQFSKLGRKEYLLLILAALALTGNYLLYVLGLEHVSPANAQLLIQLAPVLMAIGGLVFFREQFRPLQWGGFTMLILGLALFFNDQVQQMGAAMDRYTLGAMLVVLAAISWAVYALLQKQLLQHLSSQAVMVFIYIFASIALLPASEPASLLQMTNAKWLLVIFCAFNTLGAYGSFAESLEHWEMARVGAVLSLTPLGTLLTAYLVHWYQPEMLAPEQLDLVGWAGALLVVSGSMLTSLGGKRYSP